MTMEPVSIPEANEKPTLMGKVENFAKEKFGDQFVNDLKATWSGARKEGGVFATYGFMASIGLRDVVVASIQGQQGGVESAEQFSQALAQLKDGVQLDDAGGWGGAIVGGVGGAFLGLALGRTGGAAFVGGVSGAIIGNKVLRGKV